MMHTVFGILALYPAGAHAGACPTRILGAEQRLLVETVPGGAELRFSNGKVCTSPCGICARRTRPLQIDVHRKGCADRSVIVVPKLARRNPAGQPKEVGPAQAYELCPNPLVIALECQKSSK